MINFDCYDTYYKNPLGAARCESDIRFRIKVDSVTFATVVNLVARGNETVTVSLAKSGAQDGFDIFEGNLRLNKPGIYFYRFEIVKSDGTMIFAGTKDGHTALCGDWLPEWRIAAFDKDFETPTGFEGGIMYQIFPDRFFKADDVNTDGAKNERIIHENWNERPFCIYDYPEFKCNDYFLGNLKGIEQKLDYIKSLGVTHIYLNPIFESAENHRYSTSDYFKIDPYLGTTEDFESLCKTAKSKGIAIILDGVFSHTGDDSRYFDRYGHYGNKGAYNNPDSPYYDWYTFKGSADDYECWWGFKTLPNVNETEPKYMDFITGDSGVLRYWIKKGALGWRLDVADELPDEFLESVRNAVKSEDNNAVIIGEVWENAVTKISYNAQREFLLGKQCDTVMNYPFLNAVTNFAINSDATAFYNSVMEILNDYPAPSVNCIMNMLSTHDTSRILNRLGATEIPERRYHADTKLTKEQMELAISRYMTAAVLQYTLPGIPCIYYGDEAGLEGFGDPACRGTFPWGNENKVLLDYHIMLGKIRSENKQAFTKPIEFETHENGILRYRRSDIVITANRSGKEMYIENSETLLSYRFENGVLYDGGIIIQRR